MAKNLKLKIKNTQIAAAISLTGLKDKLSKAKEDAKSEAAPSRPRSKPKTKEAEEAKPKEAVQRAARARSRSAFSDSQAGAPERTTSPTESDIPEVVEVAAEPEAPIEQESPIPVVEAAPEPVVVESPPPPVKDQEPPAPPKKTKAAEAETPPVKTPTPLSPLRRPLPEMITRPARTAPPDLPARERLGPTGRHVRDLIPPPPPKAARPAPAAATGPKAEGSAEKPRAKTREAAAPQTAAEAEEEAKRGGKPARFKEYQDVKPTRRHEGPKTFDARDRQGLRDSEEDQTWRRRRQSKSKIMQPETSTIRPTSLQVRLPISIKDLAADMKLKASQLIEKLFLQGTVVTINDILNDETVVQLLGQEFGCEISIDTKEEERIRITGKSVREEIAQSGSSTLQSRPPVVAFMGHVDHGKTSLIDAIRKSNRVAGEAGAITQHIGAFQCHTPIGDITVLDTPGHEAFSAMRARGADVTDIVVLVVAGDEGIRQQTIEAIQHAKAAQVTIVVALNKADKPNFNPEMVYRQLSEQELLPEAWGGQTITVNCSAATGQGIEQLLEMLALQSEVLELKADPNGRTRGRILESEMHKGMGATATVLMQNGTLRPGDALVFGQHWGRVKTMRDDLGRNLTEALPARPVEITGLSGLPEAGQEFIVVPSEREAREIANKRQLGIQQTRLQTKRLSVENIFQQATDGSEKKILNIILRADVQGSLEALQVSLKKIESEKVALDIIASGIGEISESDVQLAMASKAVILGFHSAIESRAETLIKQAGVQVRLHDVIYHAIDEVKALMGGLLDRIAQETEKGKAEVIAIFKSSQLGQIAGCQVTEGSIARNNQIRVRRGDEVLWKGNIASLKRVKEDVREVQKGMECGILLQGFRDVQVGDILEAYETTYITQEL